MTLEAKRVVTVAVTMALLGIPLYALCAQSATRPVERRAVSRMRAAQPTPVASAASRPADMTASEQRAVQKALQEKQAVYQSLRQEHQRLQVAMQQPGASDATLRRAVSTYLAARDRAMRRLAEIDRTLMKQLSPRIQARLLFHGMIENGLGRGAGMGGGVGAGGGRMGVGDQDLRGRRGSRFPPDIRGG